MKKLPKAHSLANDMFDLWGPLMGGEALAKALGCPTTAALRQSLSRGPTPIKLFKIEGRRGRFALTQDVAEWISRQAAGGKLTGEHK